MVDAVKKKKKISSIWISATGQVQTNENVSYCEAESELSSSMC